MNNPPKGGRRRDIWFLSRSDRIRHDTSFPDLSCDQNQHQALCRGPDHQWFSNFDAELQD